MSVLKIKFLEKHHRYIISVLALLAAIFFVSAGYLIILSPDDYLQGPYAKIMYVHVPMAWLSTGMYIFLGLASFGFLVTRNPVYDLLAEAAAPIGLAFTIITLVTGAVWGKPTWGTWWVWDARLTSMLLLGFIYFGYIALRGAHSEEMRAALASAIFALVGLINIPIIKFSVYLWNTLHQKSSFLGDKGVTMHEAFLQPLLISTIFFILLACILLTFRIITIVYRKKIARLKHLTY